MQTNGENRGSRGGCFEMTITIQQIDQAAKTLEKVVQQTPLLYSKRLSKQYKANIYLKREDLQEVRSFKIRGAYNKIASLTADEKRRGVVCASAGNHAQGVALGCFLQKIKGVIFMPRVTPNQKIEKVKQFGQKYVEVKLVGQTFDDASAESKIYTQQNNMVYVHPFDDPLVIAGQGTVGKEIFEQSAGNVDIVISPIGGGGLTSGISSYLKQKNSKITIIGTEPQGAAGMHSSVSNGSVTSLETIDTFVDGAAVKTVGNMTFAICQKYVSKIVTIPEGMDCTTMIELYQKDGIIAEPAGALSISTLEKIKDEIRGKTVVCVLSGGNNDLLRYPEILERSLIYLGRKHYFIIEFAQKPGQLRQFVDQALGPTDDIVRFEYIKKTNKEKGPALVGVELQNAKDYNSLLKRMDKIGLQYRILQQDDLLYQYLV